MMENNQNLNFQTVSKVGVLKYQEALENMGFTIKCFDRFPKLAKVILPDNYATIIAKETEEFKQIDFYDENGLKRGYFYINRQNPVSSVIVLAKRMNVYSKKYGKKIEEVYFGTETEKFFSAGSVNKEIFSSPLYTANQISELRENAKEIANVLYPDWENPLKYWDKSDEQLKELMLESSRENKALLQRKKF